MSAFALHGKAQTSEIEQEIWANAHETRESL